MRHDEDQRRAIDIANNAVVSAGAGSGKTSVLTSRYLRLVTGERMRVREILALTFTRKAAAEMYERIYGALLEQAGEGADAFLREQLADFDNAAISTLDSFCAAIARNGCARFGVPATFTVDERALAARAEELALDFLLRHAEEPVVADLIRLNGFASIWKEGLAELAVNHFPVADERPLSDYLPRQRAFLDAERTRLRDELESTIGRILDLDPEGPKCIQRAQAALGGIDREAVLGEAALAEAADVEPGGLAAALEPIDLVGKQCGSSKHPDVPLYKEYVDELKDLRDRYLIVTHSLSHWTDTERLTALLEEFRARVASEKRRLAILSYHDVTSLAIRTLVEDPELRTYYKSRYRAIMIDEFQDNNDEQKSLLYLLAEASDSSTAGVPPVSALDPGKLFFVGDEKQSIYRFRGADVSVFRALADELAEDADLRLGANYRSEPGLIRFFNELFASVFAEAERPFEARFEPLRWRDATPGLRPRVACWRLAPHGASDPLYLDDTDAEAYHIATWIRDVVEQGSLPVSSADEEGRRSTRPAGYGDIAILMRSSGNQIRLERTLRLLGIPYVSQAARSLFLEAPVNDIYQILQLVVYPNDRVAYAGYLRSPLVGLSDEGIVRQLLGESELFGDVDGHGDDDGARLSIARERYDRLVLLADSSPLTRLLHTIWYEWGYRYHLLRRQEHTPYLEYYDLFWELAFSFEAEGLAAFLDEVRRHIGQNEKLDELEIIRREADGVQIMTIHKSKGLEFPVVVVANAANRGRNDSVSERPFYWSGDLGLAFNTGMLPAGEVREKPANYLYTHESDERKAQDHAELKRLLYVAATRAECHLVFSGVDRPDEAGRSMLGLLRPSFEVAREHLACDPELVVEVRDLDPVSAEAEHQARRSAGRRDVVALAAAYGAAEAIDRTLERVDWSATALNETVLAAAPARGDAAGDYAGDYAVIAEPAPIDAVLEAHAIVALFGTYCHYCIEHADEIGDTVPAAATLPASVRPPDRVPAADQELFYREGFRLARGFLESPAYRRLDQALCVEHEVGFVLDGSTLTGVTAVAPRVIRGQIDLLAELDDRAIVVDFKTDRLLDPERYRTQLAAYRAAAAALTGKPVDVELFHLRSSTVLPVFF